jgi:hypothetical protein
MLIGMATHHAMLIKSRRLRIWTPQFAGALFAQAAPNGSVSFALVIKNPVTNSDT